MSKENLFKQIVKATTSNEISWMLKSNTSHSDVIFQPNHVFRIFEGEYEKDGDQYDVLLVEKKYDDPDWDFAVEKYKVEIYFLYNNSIVLTVDESDVDFLQLIKLVQLVETSTDRAKKLLS